MDSILLPHISLFLLASAFLTSNVICIAVRLCLADTEESALFYESLLIDLGEKPLKIAADVIVPFHSVTFLLGDPRL